MPIYLSSTDYELQSKERALTNLFSHLSPKWYPVNVINSNTYDFLEMYAIQFASGSLEAQSVWKDLFIETARRSALPGQASSRLYDNFGMPLNLSKNYLQSFEDYSTGSLLQSYRQQLRLSYNNTRFGSTVEGVAGIGKSFFGAAAIPESEYDRVLGWRLSTYSGSVVSVGYNNEFIIGDTYIPGLGFKVPSREHTPIPGNNYVVSYSKLGTNTRLKRELSQKTRCFIQNYTATGSVTQVSASVLSAARQIVPASLDPINTYSDKVQVHQFKDIHYPTSGSVEGASGSYLRNTRRTSVLGEVVTGSVIQLDVSQDVDWVYDWTVLTRNESYVNVELRDYMSQSIPSTVYFQPLKPSGAEIMSFVSGSLGGHWICSNTDKLWDISGNNNTMQRYSDIFIDTPALISSRHSAGVGIFTPAGPTFFTGSVVQSGSMPLGGNWFAEMWVYGINQESAATLNHLALTLQGSEVDLSGVAGGGGFSLGFDAGFATGSTGAYLLPNISGDVNQGIKFGINGADQTAFVWVNDGTEKIATASISNYFLEEGVRPHYLACTYYSGSVYLYMDGHVIGGGAFDVASNVDNDQSKFVGLQVSGHGVGIDELRLEEGVLTPDQAYINFMEGRGGVGSYVIPSGSVDREYSQLQFRLHASGSNEIELHQYAVRGIPAGVQDIRERNSTKEVIRLPLFLTEA